TLRCYHPAAEKAYDQVQPFVQMLHTSSGEHLNAWLARVQSSELPELQSFGASIEKDKDAVRAGLTWWINNGMVEGHVTKLKLIKRQGYGKADFPLLRKRVLHALSKMTSLEWQSDTRRVEGEQSRDEYSMLAVLSSSFQHRTRSEE